ncbi:MAG TPA: peptidoglycan binding domain-containing protein [Candidatus Merdenecus merdavium]|nr:peptidoglycan binding domain-containing protein [Candidatus Merdenecus merdavium]
MAKKRIRKRKKIAFLLPILVLVAIIITIYLVGMFYFKDRFLPGTKINDRDVSNLTVKEVEDDMAADALVYILSIFDEDGNKESIKGDEFGLVYDIGSSIKDIKGKQKPQLWLFASEDDKEFRVKLSNTYDRNLLDEKIQSLSIMDPSRDVQPVDAKKELVGERYEITAHTVGTTIDRDKIYNQIIEAIDLQKAELQLSDYAQVLEPAITSDNAELVQEVNDLNKIMDISITYQFGQQERVLSGSVIKQWMTTDQQGNVHVDRASAYDYVLGLAKEFNTFGSNREFKTSDGRNITIEGGDYGWIINKDKETDYLVNLIKEGKSETREPFYESTAFTHDGVDTGNPNTYVEIDLTNQHLYYYVNGVLTVESDVVTGMKDRSPTREGTFSVMFKENDAILTGEGYTSPVKYFVAFYTDVGLHDASWRSDFGGNIYTYSGSHGCINMPEEKVKQIFNSIQQGTIVYCYY